MEDFLVSPRKVACNTRKVACNTSSVNVVLLKMINKDIREENKQEKQWKISLTHPEKLLVTQEKLLVTH